MPSKSLSKRLLLAISFLGITISAFGASQLGVFKSKTVETPQATVKPLHTKPNPVRLIISGVKINLPVTEGKIIDGVWETTQTGVSHLTISGNPGEGGNIVIYGHNKKVLFGSLPYVSMGGKITVITEDRVEHNYKVIERREVKAVDVSITYATETEILTLYTCDGPLDAKRLVLLAKPV